MAETAAERNARLQAAFDAAQAAQAEEEEPAPYYAPTSYMAPEMPTTTTPDVPYSWDAAVDNAQIQLEGPLSWTVPEIPMPQTAQAGWGDFYSEGGIPQATPQATQENYWGNFYSQGQAQAPATPSSWTEQELDMLGGMDVQDAINWGARYTGQALFGGWNVVTGEAYTGAFDMETGELVNPSLMPSLLSPEFAYALGISEEQRMMLGYNPEYPYELQDIPAGSGGGGWGYDGYGGGGGYSPSGGYGYSPTSRWGLSHWRIG